MIPRMHPPRRRSSRSAVCSRRGKLTGVFGAAGYLQASVDPALRRPDRLGSGSTEHTSTEIWSNQHRKWVMLDPTFAMYVEMDGVPLNAYELRQAWFLGEGRELVFVVGKERKRYRKSDMPVFRGRFPGFGREAVPHPLESARA